MESVSALLKHLDDSNNLLTIKNKSELTVLDLARQLHQNSPDEQNQREIYEKLDKKYEEQEKERNKIAEDLIKSEEAKSTSLAKLHSNQSAGGGASVKSRNVAGAEQADLTDEDSDSNL